MFNRISGGSIAVIASAKDRDNQQYCSFALDKRDHTVFPFTQVPKARSMALASDGN
jgi:hypothetical protein